MPGQIANFLVSLNTPSDVPVTVNFTTVDLSALAYRDYIYGTGTLTFAPGQTSRTVEIKIMASSDSFLSRKFQLLLSSPVAASLGTPASVECVISGPPSYAAVPFPGRRMAALGDSITYANNTYNPASMISNQGTVGGGTGGPGVLRNEYYGLGMTGYLAYANQIMNNAFSNQAGLIPDQNPGINATSPKGGYNFSIYSSKTSEWRLADFNPAPLPGVPVSQNRGPMYNALLNISKFDMISIMGGTNDLSGNIAPRSVLANLMSMGIELAQAGKWVFMHTITPRSADMLQLSPTGAGYMQSEIRAIMANVLAVNQGLREWLTPGPGSDVPNNIFLVDSWDKLVGPTASIIAGVPTDPAGHLSPSSGIVTGSLIPSTLGNFRTDAPNLRFCYDGLHLAPPGSYVIGKEMARVMKIVGVPVAANDTSEGGSTVAGAAPITFGTNLMVNKTFAKSTSIARTAGAPMVLGRAIGLGAPIPVSGTPAVGTFPNNDAFTNQGAGYTHGQVPDYWFVYRASNADNESFSNFNGFTYIAFPQNAANAPAAIQTNATWADGCLTTAITSENFTLNDRVYVAEPGFALTFNRAAGVIGADTASRNASFVARYIVGEGQNGPWNNYGYEVFPQRPWPSPPYAPGEALMMDCIMKFSGVSPNLRACRVVANFLSIDFNNGNTNSAVISGIAQSESFFPFNNVVNCVQHTEDRYMAVRVPIVRAPTPGANEIAQYCQMVWQISFDCETMPATGTITIIRPRLSKVTVPVGM